MYSIKPYDLSKSFRLIPNGEKYQMTLWQGNTVRFTNRKDAFKFISAISILFTEVLSICELIHLNNNLYRFQIKPKNNSVFDKSNIYCNNDVGINQLLRELKFFQNDTLELYQLIKKYSLLLSYLKENTNILHEKLGTVISGNVVLINNIDVALRKVLNNPIQYFKENKMSVFAS